MKSLFLALVAAVALVACGKPEEKPATVTTPVVDGQNQPVKTESGAPVVTEAPKAEEKKEEVKK